jgi:rhodanese-related sulfurtransferase
VLGGGAEQTQDVTIDEARELANSGAVVIDVREADDVAEGTFPGSRNIPYRLVATAPDLPTDRPIVTVCETGGRAAIAASVLRSLGYDARPVVTGGIATLSG